MDITPPIPLDANIINGYGKVGIKINNKLITNDIIVSSTFLLNWENAAGIFAVESYKQVINNLNNHLDKTSNKIILIGTGKEYISPPSSFSSYLAKYNIVPEIMSTAAACRTYNVLLSEQRNIIALLCNLISR